ncbi:cobalamin biosynthesis protein CobW [Pseudomonas capeferrum]
MLQNIPTHVIAGPLGAGKTTLIRHLLAQRPPDERWAVLINEFGLVGLDAALLSRDEDGIAIGEVAGGCLCCVNGMPFQVGLGRLLRKSRPDRLFIEPSGLGHPLQLLAQLKQAPWAGVLTIQPLLMVVDAQKMARGEALPEAQLQAFDAAKAVVFNKSEAVDEYHRLLITKKFNEKDILWASHGNLPLSVLPVSSTGAISTEYVDNRIVDNLGNTPAALWNRPDEPICLVQQGEGAGVLAGAGIRVDSFIHSGFGRFYTAGHGSAPRELSTLRKAGNHSMGLRACCRTGSRATGAEIRASS